MIMLFLNRTLLVTVLGLYATLGAHESTAQQNSPGMATCIITVGNQQFTATLAKKFCRYSFSQAAPPHLTHD